MAERGSDASDSAASAGPADGAGEHETGSEVLFEEAREEVVRLVTHPVAELKRLEHVADEGESAATPLIVAVGVIVAFAIVAAIVMTALMFIYYDA